MEERKWHVSMYGSFTSTTEEIKAMWFAYIAQIHSCMRTHNLDGFSAIWLVKRVIFLFSAQTTSNRFLSCPIESVRHNESVSLYVLWAFCAGLCTVCRAVGGYISVILISWCEIGYQLGFHSQSSHVALANNYFHYHCRKNINSVTRNGLSKEQWKMPIACWRWCQVPGFLTIKLNQISPNIT